MKSIYFLFFFSLIIFISYKYAYKIQPLLHKKTYFIDFRLVKYLYIYDIKISNLPFIPNFGWSIFNKILTKLNKI